MAAVTCQEIRDLFSARADEALTAAERVAVDAHLQTCADCAREWQRFAATVSLLRAVEPARAPAGFVDRVLAARPRPWYRRLARTMLVPWSVKLPLEAAAVVLVAGLAVVIFQRSPDLQQAALAPEAPVTVRALESAPADSTPAAPGPSAPVPAAPTPTAPGPTPTAPAPTSPSAPSPVPASPPAGLQGFANSGAAAGRPPSERAKSTTSEPAEPLPDSRTSERDRERRESPRLGITPPRGAAGTATTTAPEAKKEASDEQPARPAPVTTPPRPSEDAALPRSAPAPRAAPGQKPVQVEGLMMRRDARVAAVGHVEARLAAPDRAAAEREIRALVARLGGVVTAEAESLEIVVPRDAWDELAREMGRIGTLRIERRPPDLPPAVRVTLRLD